MVVHARQVMASLAFVTLLLTGCTSGAPDPGAAASTGPGVSAADVRADAPRPRDALRQGGELTLPLAGLPQNLNRFHVDGALAPWREVTSATDPGLYRYSPEGAVSPRPEYLTAMPTVETKDGAQVITYDLNPQAVWNDGTPIDWTAFEATWKVLRAPVDSDGPRAIPDAAHARIASVAAGDAPSRVVVTMSAPTYPVTALFTHLIHPRLATAKAFDTLMMDDPHPELRSGPFTITSVDRQNGVVELARNPRWWGAPPLLEHITFRQMEPQAAGPAFIGGEIDALDVGDPATYNRVRNAADVDLRTGPQVATTVLVFNAHSPRLGDTAVRKALWQAIDRNELATVRFNGLEHTENPAGSALYQPFQPEAQDNMPVAHDPAAAGRTLDGAGWAPGSDGIRFKDGGRLTVRFTLHGDDPLGTALAQTVQNQLQAVGVEVRIDARPMSAFGQTMTAKDYDLLMGGGASDSPSPIGALCQTMCSTSPANASGAGTPELDARIAKVDTIADDRQRATEINGIEKEWLQQYGQMPLWHGADIQAWRTGLANLGPAGFASMTPAWENVGWER